MKSQVYIGIFLITSIAHAMSNPASTESSREEYLTSQQLTYRAPIDFHEAVDNYIDYTTVTCIQEAKHIPDDKISYRKELRALFTYYKKLSTKALLERLRSAHNDFTEYGNNAHPKKDQYEQISSALLLVCVDRLLQKTRDELLQTLDEINHLILYWKYQLEHPIFYFFHKSPLKWFTGKDQTNEILISLDKLEKKQKDLYETLGSLASHMHEFTIKKMDYHNCYQWVTELLIMVAPLIKTRSQSLENPNFNELINQLQAYDTVLQTLSRDCLLQIRPIQKPSVLTQNWIKYTFICALCAYGMHYYTNNTISVNTALSKKLSHLYQNWKDLVVKPSKNVLNTIFGYVEPQPLDSTVSDLLKDIQDIELHYEINKEASDKFKKSLADDYPQMQHRMQTFLKRLQSRDYITQEQYDKIINEEANGAISAFKETVFNLNKGLVGGLILNDDLISGIFIFVELFLYHNLTKQVQLVFELVAEYGITTVKELLKVLAQGNAEWASVYKKVNLILNVAVLTPTIIVASMAGFGAYKFYRYTTANDYSPIRIGLAHINSLLIESQTNLSNNDYGKLLYLIHVLRSNTTQMKNTMTREFLKDITKLESKRYSTTTKHDLINNMFNKYIFLGRIVTQG